MLRFTWDPKKATANAKKHGVAFPEAATAFGDPLSLAIPDSDHSEREARFLLVGLTSQGRLVVVGHVEDDDSVISSTRVWRREQNVGTYEEEPSG